MIQSGFLIKLVKPFQDIVNKRDASKGYGLMLLVIFITSTVLLGTSLQMVVGAGVSNYTGTMSQDNISAKQLAQTGMETVLSDIQTKLNIGTTVDTSYTYTSASITMPNDPASLGGGTSVIGSFSATMTAARANTFLVKVTAVVNSATSTYSRLITMNRTSKVLDSMTGANAAYSLRKLTTTYNGSAIRIRRSSDNTEQDIGFDGNGNLDVNSLKTFLTASTPPVDSVGSAAVAFGVRRLRTAYTGYAMNVRRSSDSTTQDIGFTSNGELDTVSLMSFVGTGTGYVTKWYDQSGNGTDASQGTTSSQPTIVRSGVLNMVNNRPAILYDGANDRLLFTRSVSDDFSLIACYSAIAGYQAASGNPYWTQHAGLVDGEVAGAVNDFGMSIDTSGQIYAGMGYPGNPDISINSTNPGYNDARMHWAAMTRTKSTGAFNLYHDFFSYSGPNISGVNTSSLTAPTNLCLGELQTNINAFNGYINEVLIYGSSLSSTNRQLIQRNESWYFNMYPIWNGWTNPLNAIGSIPANTLAYGLRKLNSGYNYNAIQVRRSSDNTTQNIGWDAASNLDVASLMTFVGAGSGYITTVYDQSGITGANLSQGTAGYQPRIVNAGVLDTVNGKPAMYFDGVDDYLTNTGLTANTSNSVSALVYGSQSSNQGTYARLVSVYANGRWDYDNATSASLIQVNNDNSRTLQTERNSGSTGRLTTTPTFEYGVPFLGTSIFDGTNGYLYLNGGFGASYAYNSTFNYANILLGHSPTGDYLRGYITEAYLFPNALSSSDRIALEQNILFYHVPPLVSAYVSKWYDQSGNSRDMTQTDPTLQPSIMMPPYGTASIYPTVMFNGAQFLSTTTGMPTNADYSKIAVFSYFDSTKANNIIGGTASNTHAFYMASSNYICLFQYSACYATSTLPMTANASYAVAATYTNASPTRTGIVYRSNTQGGTGSTGHANGSDTSISLGAYNGGNFFYGTLSEAMIFARSLSAADRTTIYNDERGYFGTQ